MAVQSSYHAFEGGLDTVSPPITIDPGKALLMQNYEPWYNGGYRRINGYERFDGRPAPSAATYTGFTLDTVVGLTVGTTVLTGDTSSATGVFVASSDNAIAVTKVTGTFTQGETFNSGAYTMAASPTYGLTVSPTADIGLTFQLAAEDEYRRDIAVPAGSGEVRGIWQLKDKVYAWRNNAGATAGIMFQSSTAGWTTTGITMAETIYFDAAAAGGANVAEGDTINGATSGATGVVHRIVLQAGAYDGSGAGYYVLTGVTGGPFQDNEGLREGATAIGTAAGINTTFAFSINGHYQFINHNFFGGASTYRAYGCNGVDSAFEIDENQVVAPILHAATALTNQPSSNTPQYVEEHRNYLFLAFPGGLMEHSVQGEPMQFNGFLGAAEFGMGDEITGLNSTAGPTLVITSQRETRGLFGKDTTDWELKILGAKSGGKGFSTQKLDTVYAMDDLGITSLSRTDAFGDFAGATVSQHIQDIINAKKSLLTSSVTNRTSNQIRMYFSDNTALVMYMPLGTNNNRTRSLQNIQAQFGFLKYSQPINRIYNSDDADDTEVTYFASDDGYVYQDQKGNSFDGANIVSYTRLHFNNLKSPAMRKRFRKAELELDAAVNTELKFIADIGYGKASTFNQNLSIAGGGGFWNEVNWDGFNWSSPALSTASAKLTGTGDNIGFLIYNDSATAAPFILQGLTLHYEPRRLKR